MPALVLLLLTVFLLTVFMVACSPRLATLPENPLPEAVVVTSPEAVVVTSPEPTATAIATATTLPTLPPPPTLTAVPTQLPPTLTPTPTATASPTPIPSCAQRLADTDTLFTLVTATYGLSREYAPTDLVLLTDYLPFRVTLGYPTEIRQVVLAPLTQMITDMETAGLHPTVLSGYRSYAAQTLARQKWVEKTPDTVNMFSALPGHSEHQLGTTLDFGSPELPAVVGQEDVEFHTYFYMTSEGEWLAAHAHEYGFTLSYHRDTYELTGMYYEPWHYRYVGVEMAMMLHDLDISFIEYTLANTPPPCVP